MIGVQFIDELSSVIFESFNSASMDTALFVPQSKNVVKSQEIFEGTLKMTFRWIVRQCGSLSKAIRKHIVSVSYLNIHLPSLILNAATNPNCSHAFS